MQSKLCSNFEKVILSFCLVLKALTLATFAPPRHAGKAGSGGEGTNDLQPQSKAKRNLKNIKFFKMLKRETHPLHLQSRWCGAVLQTKLACFICQRELLKKPKYYALVFKLPKKGGFLLKKSKITKNVLNSKFLKMEILLKTKNFFVF